MPRVIVQTDDGREVSRFDVPMVYPGNGLWARLLGRYDAPLGWLGRSLSDAKVIQEGGDPERPSERAIRLAAEIRADEEASGLYGTGDPLADNERWSRKAEEEA